MQQHPRQKHESISRFVPTDGTELPIMTSGDFGRSPFCRQLSDKQIYLIIVIVVDAWRANSESSRVIWVLRSGAPWRDLPENYGPPTTCYNRFVRWRQAGVWDRLMNALAAGHDAAVQMIDTSVVRVHQHGAVSRAMQSNIWGAREED